MNPQYEAHERMCKSIGDMAKENQRLQDRIIQLEEELMDAKNKYAVLVADVVLYEDRGERIRLLISERDSARLQADQKISLREEFRELLGTDEIEQGITVVCDLKQLASVRLAYITQLETENDAMRADLLLWQEKEVKP